MRDLELTTVPKNLYYNEIAYVRILEDIVRLIAQVVNEGRNAERVEFTPLFDKLAECRTKL